MDRRHVATLDKRLKTLNALLGKLALERDIAELIRIIRKPGWTTPAEFQLTIGIADSMIHQARGLIDSKQSLLKGSRLVGK
jgi:hypothetical protein